MLVEKLKAIDDCIVHPPCGLPNLKKGLSLPEDVKEFYELCGGIDLYIKSENFPYTIVSPDKFRLANNVILGEKTANEIENSPEYKDDITKDCYTIAEDSNSDYLVIDLNQARLGLSYDGFHETYGLAGNMPVIARNFTDMLERLINNQGKYIYWLEQNFINLGDAYDR